MKTHLACLLLFFTTCLAGRGQSVQVKWTVPDEVDYYEKTFVTDQAEQEIKVDISGIAGIPAAQIKTELWVDGKPYTTPGRKLGEISLKDMKRGNLRFLQTIVLTEGESVWQIKVSIPKQPLMLSAPMRMRWDAGKPNLYLICVGVPYALEYARRDAAELFTLFRAQAGHLYGNVQGELLICDENTSRGRIAQTIANLQAERITAKDLVILFFSGHGRATDAFGANDFGLVTNDAAAGVLEDDLVLLSYQQNVLRYINALPCKRLIMVDACHSGTAGGRKQWTGDFKAAQQALATAPSGVVTISSSSGIEASYEDASWQHGAFTYALLEGFGGKADENRDGNVTVREISGYLENRVPIIVNERKGAMQHPRLINPPEKDYPIYNYLNKDPSQAIPEPCATPTSPGSTNTSTRNVVSIIGANGKIADDELTHKAIGYLKESLPGFVIRKAENRSLDNPLLEMAGYVCVVRRQPTIYRKENYADGSSYWLAEVPLKIECFDTRDGHSVFSTGIAGKAAQAADYDKATAEADALEKAFEAIRQKKLTITE